MGKYPHLGNGKKTILTQEGCPRVCKARTTDEAAMVDGRYLRKGCPSRVVNSQRYWKTENSIRFHRLDMHTHKQGNVLNKIIWNPFQNHGTRLYFQHNFLSHKLLRPTQNFMKLLHTFERNSTCGKICSGTPAALRNLSKKSRQVGTDKSNCRAFRTSCSILITCKKWSIESFISWQLALHFHSLLVAGMESSILYSCQTVRQEILSRWT